MAFKGALIIDTEKCKHCKACELHCKCIGLSKHVNAKGYNYLEMTNEDACVGCASCAVICPDGVIEVYRAKE